MEIENSSLMSSDDISTITAGSIEHATDTSAATEEPSITDELKPYGLHLSTGVPTIVFDPEENFITSSKPIPPDDISTNIVLLHCKKLSFKTSLLFMHCGNWNWYFLLLLLYNY